MCASASIITLKDLYVYFLLFTCAPLKRQETVTLPSEIRKYLQKLSANGICAHSIHSATHQAIKKISIFSCDKIINKQTNEWMNKVKIKKMELSMSQPT